MKMVDMKRTAAEKKALNTGANKQLVGSSSLPEDYGYGLRLDLSSEHLDKLGIDNLPRVGKTVTLHAKAKVIAVRQNQRSGQDNERSVELQLQKIGLCEGMGSMEDAISSGVDDADGDE